MLPMQLAEGLVLAGVELECRGCGHSYRLTKGQGRAGAPGARIALAARSQCPRCATAVRFLVVVDMRLHHASVQRVSKLGLWLAEGILQMGRIGRQPAPLIKPVVPNVPEVRQPVVVPSSTVIGRYADRDIPAWIDVDGRRCTFVGVEPITHRARRAARSGEIVIAPGLVYRAEIRTVV